MIQDYLDHEIIVLYRDFCCSLHKSYKKCNSLAEARKHRDKRVTQDSDWAHLCDRWERGDFKRVNLKQILRHDLNFHSLIEVEL